MQNYSKNLSVIISEGRLALGISQKELAMLTGLTPALISRYESGKSRPRAETMDRIAQVLKINSSLLFESALNESPTLSIPFLSNVDMSPLDQSPLIIKLDEIRKMNAQRNGLCAMEILGNSMSPVLNDGDSVLIDRTEQKISDGKIFLIEHGGLIIIKRLYNMPFGGIRIVSDNRLEFPELQLTLKDRETQELNIIGRVVWRGGNI